MRQRSISFDGLLTETITEVVRNVFDDEIAEIILKYLKENTSGRLDEKVKIFADALPKILGVGSVIIEDLILETLYCKCALELQWKKGYKFTDYIMVLSKQFRNGEGQRCPT